MTGVCGVTIAMTSQVLELLTVVISQDRSRVGTAIGQNVMCYKTTHAPWKELYGNLCFRKDQGTHGT